MSTKTAATPKDSTSLPDRGQMMTGAEILVSCMEREGVDTIFAYPGGASMPIHQALTASKQIRTIMPRHEQGGGFAAEGYARVTGRPGDSFACDASGRASIRKTSFDRAVCE